MLAAIYLLDAATCFDFYARPATTAIIVTIPHNTENVEESNNAIVALVDTITVVIYIVVLPTELHRCLKFTLMLRHAITPYAAVWRAMLYAIQSTREIC